MCDLFVRVSRPYEDLQPVLERIANASSKMIVYEHPEDDEVSRTHVHFAVAGFERDKETMKNWIKNFLPQGISKSDWAFKALVTFDGTITYMSKGEYIPKLVKNVSDETIRTQIELWDERDPKRRQKTLTQYVVKETPKESKKRQNELVDEMLEILKIRHGAETFLDHHATRLKDEDVIDAIIYVLNKHHTIFGRYKVRDYYDTIMSRAQPNLFKYDMLKMIGFPMPRGEG